MDLTLRYYRINNYITTSLVERRKSIEEYYIHNYNPFYKWNIGSLKNDEIVKALSLYFSKEKTDEKIRNNIVNSKAFSLLLNSFKEIAASKEPENLVLEQWNAIRSHYESSCKKENETTFGEIGFDENYGSYPSGSHEVDDKDSQNLELTLEVLLNTLYQGNWGFKIIDSSNEHFQFQIAIVNLSVDNDIFDLAVAALKKKYPNSLFTLKRIQDNLYIEGFI